MEWGGDSEQAQVSACKVELEKRMERAALWEQETRHLPPGNKERDAAVENKKLAALAGSEFMLVYVES